MDVKLDGEQMNAIVSKAILDTLTPEVRANLTQASITELLTKKSTNSYGRQNSSELQAIFEQCTREVARKIITENMADDADFRAKVDGVFRDAVTKAFSNEGREKMVNAIAEQLITGLKIERY